MPYPTCIPYIILEINIRKKKVVDQKIANKLEFKEGEQLKHKVDTIIDSIVFAKEATDSRPSKLYFLIYQKRETHAEDIWELVKGIFYLK